MPDLQNMQSSGFCKALAHEQMRFNCNFSSNFVHSANTTALLNNFHFGLADRIS